MSEFKSKVEQSAADALHKTEKAISEAAHKAKNLAVGAVDKVKHSGNTVTEKVHIPPEPTVIVSDDAKRPHNWVKNTNS